MSTQMNYYGGWNSSELIFQRFSEEIGPFNLFEARSSDPLNSPVKLESLRVGQVKPRRKLVIVAKSDFCNIVLSDVPDNQKMIDIRASQAVEWTPAVIIDGIAYIGRLYTPSTSVHIRKPLARIFKSLKKKCQTFKYGHQYMVFPEASQIPLLQGWVGKPYVNPLLANQS